MPNNDPVTITIGRRDLACAILACQAQSHNPEVVSDAGRKRYGNAASALAASACDLPRFRVDEAWEGLE